ncbi:uncharacterized protein LA080_012327 [Diaporthe eres]|uniref:Protein kinase domain-containing protein n=1 Tax=Diaporthe vaccinii TaxID=105482 RepID=A0ABR4DSA3_9PEZI|nr:uncharacterized protein LA080_012327 [Diaporthe eres]
MARTCRTGPELKPTAAIGSSRPQPLCRNDPNSFTADIGLILATQVHDAVDSVILLPPEYIHDPEPDSPEAPWRECYDAKRCWKTTVAYEQISSSSSTQLHPHIVPFIRRGPWTALPILARPSGPPLDRFLAENKAAMYDEGSHRVRATHRPLAYKWALHLASALEFVHAQDIVIGDLSTAHCWLSRSPALSLCLVGFLDASFRDRSSGVLYLGGTSSSEPFHPLNVSLSGSRRAPEPSVRTDLFLWGCVVYELMVGHWPGHEEGARRSWDDTSHMTAQQEWPGLESEGVSWGNSQKVLDRRV